MTPRLRRVGEKAGARAARPSGFARAVASLTLLFCTLLASPRAAASTAEAVLYTLGPGSAFSQRYGHSVICTREAAGVANGSCVDFGIAQASSSWDFSWSVLRGQPRFVPVRLAEQTVLEALRAQGRKLELQVLPLQGSQLEVLATELTRATDAGAPYVYHPLWSNCSTRLRDHLDQALGGRLREVSGALEREELRLLAEQGNSGHLPELVLFALVLGAPMDRPPTSWEAMFLPTRLRDGLGRLGAVPTEVAEQQYITLPTSRHVGRGLLVALGLALAALAALGGPKRQRAALFALSFALGGLGLLCWGSAALCEWSEVRYNWALALLVPTDLALPWLRAAARDTYLKGRLVTCAALTASSLLGVIAQPLWFLALLAGLPLATWWWRSRAHRAQQDAASAAASGVTPSG